MPFYFDFVKKEFIDLKNNSKFNSDDLTPKAKTMFNNVLNSSNLDDYLNRI